jgi:hypothetical protein
VDVTLTKRVVRVNNVVDCADVLAFWSQELYDNGPDARESWITSGGCICYNFSE